MSDSLGSQIEELFRRIEACFRTTRDDEGEDRLLAGKAFKIALGSLPCHPSLEVTAQLADALDGSGSSAVDESPSYTTNEGTGRASMRAGSSSSPSSDGSNRGGSNRVGESLWDLDPVVLSVAYPGLDPVPEPPREVRERLLAGWQDPSREPVLVQQFGGSEAPSSGLRRANRATADPELAQWLTLWRAWSKRERAAGRVRQLYERLFDLFSELNGGVRLSASQERAVEPGSESVRELVLIDGLLWLPGSRLRGPLPLISQSVELQLAGEQPTFQVRETATPPELNVTALEQLGVLSARALRDFACEFEELGYHPLQGASTTRFFHRLISEIGRGGEVLLAPIGDGVKRPIWPTDRPIVERNPSLLLRSSRVGRRTVERIRADLEGLEDAVSLARLPIARLVEGGPVATGRSHEQDAKDDLDTLLADDLLADDLVPDLAQHDFEGQDSGEHDSGEPWSSPRSDLLDRLGDRSAAENTIVLEGSLRDDGCFEASVELVEHCLEQGLSVLVTGRDSTRLDALHSALAEPLQPLCLNITRSESSRRASLEQSVEAIVERLSTVDPRRLESEATQIERRRQQVRANLEEAKMRWDRVRKAEAELLKVGRIGFLPAEAGGFVAANRRQLDWIPGPLEKAAALPMTASEIGALYESQAALSLEQEAILAAGLPAIDEIPEPDVVASLFETRQVLETRSEASYGRALAASSACADLFEQPARRRDGRILQREETRLRSLIRGLERRSERQPWLMSLLEVGLDDRALRSWFSMLEWIVDLRTSVLHSKDRIATASPSLAEDLAPEDQTRIAIEIEQHLRRTGRSFGQIERFLRRDWSRLARRSRVHGEVPRTVEDFAALAELARLESERRRIVRQWRRLAVPIGFPDVTLTGAVEEQLERWVPVIRRVLRLPGIWLSRVKRRLAGAGVDRTALERLVAQGEPLFSSAIRFLHTPVPSAATTTIGTVAPRPGALLALRLEGLLAALEARSCEAQMAYVSHAEAHCMASVRVLTPRSEPVTNMLEALENRDAPAYRAAFEKLRAAAQLEPLHLARRRLLKRLSTKAPAWALALERREGYHGLPTMPGDPERAWRWRQFVEEFDRRAGLSLDAVAREIRHLAEEVSRLSQLLTERRAWARQIRRTSLEHHQSLLHWRDLMSRLGGAPMASAKMARLKRDARALMHRCQRAVPAWVVPVDRLTETFEMRLASFDVVIVDEASSMSLGALPAVYLAKQVVLTRGSSACKVARQAPGSRASLLARLRKHDDQPDDGRASTLATEVSLLDALEAHPGGHSIDPRKPGRSVNEIAALAEAMAEGIDGEASDPSEYVPLRPLPTRRFGQSLVAVSAEGLGAPEDVAVSLMGSCLSRERYRGSDFAILAAGAESSDLERRIRALLSPRQVLGGRIYCEDLNQPAWHQFDVVFLVAPRIEADPGTEQEHRQVLRLQKSLLRAARRSRFQLWVIHSLPSQGDYEAPDPRGLLTREFRPLLEELHDERDHDLGRLDESRIAQPLADELERLGFRVSHRAPLPRGGKDSTLGQLLLVKGLNLSVAVDLSDEATPPCATAASVLRQLDWPVLRVSPGQFFRDPRRSVARLVEELASLGLSPVPEQVAQDLERDSVRSICREAERLRQSWFSEAAASTVA